MTLPMQDSKETLSAPGEVSSLLDSLVKLAPVFKSLVPLDCMIAVTDRQKYLCQLNGREIKLPPEVKPGALLPEGDAIYEAVHTGNVVTVTVPRDIFGVPFKATAVPVRDGDGKVIGGVGLGVSLFMQETLVDVACTLADSAQQNLAKIEELANASEESAKLQEMVQAVAGRVQEQVNKTDVVLNFINQMLGNTNLLGLNAAIEAARAGEYGRGFSVVAGEIRKMSANSAQSVREIKDILNNISLEVALMVEKINEVSNSGRLQAEAAREITESMHTLAEAAEKIEKVSEIL